MDILVIIVKVILPLPIRQYFEYFMPDFIRPVIGGRIIVPFRSKDMIGIVISFYTTIDASKLHFKYVKSLIDNQSLYTKSVLDILTWINKNYHCFVGKLFFSVLPNLLCKGYIVKKKCIYQWNITEKGKKLDVNELKRKKKQLYTLLVLKKNSILSTELKKYNLSKFILKKLEIQNLCQVYTNNEKLIPHRCNNIIKKIILDEKTLVVIKNIFIKKCFSSWLLTKITLYAKVKFYLGVIESVLRKGMQILILVPYIKNIYVIEKFLKKYFNVSIDAIHSELTNAKYLKNWIRTKNGDNSIIIGTKKSIFLPFLKLGVIIFLEEHNLYYKNMHHCRYNVRDIGILRAYKENIPIILDSDTPSLKTLYNISSKKCFYIKLHKCHDITKLKSSLINLKIDRIKFGLSLTLIKEIYKKFSKKQVLLIFNKCSLFFFVLTCNACGWIFRCTICHEYFEINQYHNTLFCKFCLVKITKPIFCYHCSSISLIIINIGIEKIKTQIQKIFPKRPLLFLLNKKKICSNIFRKKIFTCSVCIPYIIISTEEIVQNYYFPHVQLISLMCIDYYFLSFQFRDVEYFAQFYINLNKLIGNKNNTCTILVQTSLPNDPNLQELCQNGYFSFADKILISRKKFLLPPWSVQSIVYAESARTENNFIFLNLIREILQKKSKKYNYILWCVGPYPNFLLKNKNKYFHQLLIQCSSRIRLHNLLNECMEIIHVFTIVKRVRWFIDIEPY